MKILITADIHNGVPNKLVDTIWSMDIIRQYAKQQSITDIIVAGDLFHDRVNLNIEVLNSVYSVLKLAKQDNQKWHIFPGNHDMFLKNSWDVTAIRIFRDIHEVTENVSFKIFDGRKFWIVPFIYYEDKYMDIINKINSKVSKDDILLTHIGVNGASLNECFLLKNWNVVSFENTNFHKIFTGHFHCHQQVGEKTWYPGSPIPFRFDEGVVDHGFIIYDTESSNVEFIDIRKIAHQFSDYLPPDYITIIDEDIKDNLDWVKNNNVRIVVNDKTNNEIVDLKKQIMDNGALSVSLMNNKKDTSDIKTMITESKSNESFFEDFVAFDKPKLDTKLLKKLHDIIKIEADQRYVVEEIDDA